MSVQVRTLGPLRVERDGEELRGAPLGGARERRLLAILAVARGHVVSRDALMERLWEQPPRDPHAGVDTAISRLRRALGPAGTTVETCRPGYRLSCSTDLAHLDQLEARREFDEALELTAAVFLDGEPPTEWIDEQRRELARRRVDLLAGGGRAAAERGEHLVALERWREAVTLEPLREDAHRGVLDGLSRLGRGAEALRFFEHCRRVLRNELGIDPAPETTAVYETILAGDHHSHPRLSNGPRAAGQDPPFIGRGREVAWLRAGTEGCAVRVVLGEPGIGKSRLVQEATTDRDGRSVRMAKCSRLVAPVPYAVLADLASESLADLAVVGGSLSPQSSIARLSRHWRLKLAESPSVCIIDDLQWADEASLIVLGLVLRDRPPGVTVIVTARPAELDPDGTPAQFLDLVADLRMTETVRLGPLTAEELAAAGLPPSDWAHSGGHPLLLTERLRGGTDDDLAALVLTRAAAIGSTAVEVLRAAAILDRPASLVQVAEVAALDLPVARAAAHRLAKASLLAERGGTWTVCHDVVAALVRDELDVDIRRQRHEAALAVLSHSKGPAAVLAHHALAAGNREATLRHSLDAAEDAAAAFANREAADHYRRAIEAAGASAALTDRRRAVAGLARALLVLGRADDALDLLGQLPATTGRDEVERLLMTAECRWAAWQPSRALPPARHALDLAERLNDQELTSRVHGFIANPYGSLGELALAKEHVDAAVAIAAELRRPPPALVWYRLALLQHHACREIEALQTLDRCRTSARAQLDERAAVLERIVRSWVLGAIGHYGGALAALDDIPAIGRGEEAVAAARVPNSRGALLADLGLTEQALDADEESVEAARARPGPAVAEPMIHSLLNLALDHLALGDPDRAAARLAEAEVLAVDAEYARFRYLNRLHWVRGLVVLEAGDVDASLDAAAKVGQMAEQYGAPKYEIRARMLTAQALLRRPGESVQAAAQMRQAAHLAERLKLAAMAEAAHRLAARHSGSAYHARRADQWRARMVGSVTGTTVARLGDLRRPGGQWTLIAR